jgi:hypothetical protein
LKRWFDQWTAVFGAEDQVEEDIAGCMRHFLSPLRGLVVGRLPTACAVGCILALLRSFPVLAYG